MINYYLKINFQDEKILSSDLTFVSGDIGAYKLIFDFYDNGKKVDASKHTLSVKAKRSDGVKIASAGKMENGQAIFIPENNIYSVPGDLYLEVALCDAAGKYITAKIIIASVIEGLGETNLSGTDIPSVYVTLLGSLQEKIDQTNKIVRESIPVKGVDYFDGIDGKDGVDGYTPKKGVDYYTQEEKEEFQEEITQALKVFDGELTEDYNEITKAEKINKVTTPEELLASETNAILYGYKHGSKALETDALFACIKVFVKSGDVIRQKLSNYWGYNSYHIASYKTNGEFEGVAWTGSDSYTVKDGVGFVIINIREQYNKANGTCLNGFDADIITINQDPSLTKYDNTLQAEDYVPKEAYYTFDSDIRIKRYEKVLNDVEDVFAEGISNIAKEIEVQEGEYYDVMTRIDVRTDTTPYTYDEDIYVVPSTGEKVSHTSYRLYELMKINVAKEKLFTYLLSATSDYPRVVFYDEKQNYISVSAKTAEDREYYENDGTQYYGLFHDIPENAAYFRINITKARCNSSTYFFKVATEKKNNHVYMPNLVLNRAFEGMNILNLGDSIFGNDRKENISEYLADLTGATVYNGGFGGTRMTSRPSDNAYEWFDGVNLVTALTSGDWSNQEANVSNVTTTYYPETLAMLKGLDMSKIDVITLAWGTNDYTAGKTLSEITTALESIIDMIQSTYPTIRILVCTPIWRYFDEGDSDTKVYKDATLKQIAQSIEETAKNKRISVLNSYQNMPLCENTALTYFDEGDKTHLNSKGNKLYAQLIYGKLNSIMAGTV